MINQSELKEIIEYNPDTGVFTWKISKQGIKKKQAGSGDGKGYIDIKINQKKYKAHRLAWLYMTGELPGKQIDHINHNRSDNRWGNLRLASHSENMRNQTIPKNNNSGVIGVFFHKRDKKWIASINHKNRKINLGSFAKKHQAIAARKQAEIKHGYHENHGRG